MKKISEEKKLKKKNWKWCSKISSTKEKSKSWFHPKKTLLETLIGKLIGNFIGKLIGKLIGRHNEKDKKKALRRFNITLLTTIIADLSAISAITTQLDLMRTVMAWMCKRLRKTTEITRWKFRIYFKSCK